MLTLGGETQKIWLFFRRPIAKETPTDMVAGRAGGTVMVIKSNDLSISCSVLVPWAIKLGSVQMNPRMPTIAMIPTNINESL